MSEAKSQIRGYFSVENRIIVLKSLYHKERRFIASPVREAATGLLKGVEPITEDMKKKYSYHFDHTSEVEIKNGKTFDLNDQKQRDTWEWVKHCKEIAPDWDTAQNSGRDVLFYIEDEKQEVATSLKESDVIFRAMEFVQKDASTNYASRVKIYGTPMDGQDPDVIKNFLIREAMNKATAPKIIALYESSDTSLQLLFLNAVDKEVITRADKGIYMYGEVVLGSNTEAAMASLKDPMNNQLVREISQQVNPNLYPKK